MQNICRHPKSGRIQTLTHNALLFYQCKNGIYGRIIPAETFLDHVIFAHNICRYQVVDVPLGYRKIGSSRPQLLTLHASLRANEACPFELGHGPTSMKHQGGIGLVIACEADMSTYLYFTCTLHVARVIGSGCDNAEGGDWRRKSASIETCSQS